MGIWAEPFTKLRIPKLFDLRSDPYERADITSNTYYDWLMSDGAGLFIAAPPIVGKFLATFKDYPPSQRPSSFSIDQIAAVPIRCISIPPYCRLGAARS
jgi:hypothetical protein